MSAEKRDIRNAMILKRKTISKEIRTQKSQQIFNYLSVMTKIINAKRIMVYIDFQEEVETRNLITFLWLNSIEVVVPVCDAKKRELNASLLYSFDELAPGAFGVLEPTRSANRFVDVETIDVIIIPGLGFDRHGGRIGYGAGYYDRFFERTPSAQLIAIAYHEQVIEKIPMEEHDKRMPVIVTDKEVIFVKSI